MERKYIIGICLVALVALGLGLREFWQRQPASLEIPVATTITHNRIPYDVVVSRNKETVAPGTPARYRFEVREGGRLVDLAANEIYPHIALVSQDLSDIAFYHIDRLVSPQPGIYEFDHIFSADSPYQIWFEINDNTTVDHHGGQSSYIAKIDMPVGGTTTPAAQRATTTDGAYRLTFEPETMRVGGPSVLRIAAENTDGTPVPLVTDVDHFYFAASPSEDFYVLDHPDLALTKDNTVTINNLTLPKAGSYAFWVRVFVSDADNQPIDLIEGSFVISAR